MSYQLQICDAQDRWRLLDQFDGEAAACVAFDLEVERGTRGVRVLDQDGTQIAAFWPGREAA